MKLTKAEAQKILNIDEFFRNQPKEDKLGSLKRGVFYDALRELFKTDDLNKIRERLERIIQEPDLSKTVSEEAVERAKEEAEVTTEEERALRPLRRWLKLSDAKTPEEIAQRDVAAAELEATMAQIETQSQEITRPPIEPGAEGPISVGLTITPQAAKTFSEALEKGTAEVVLAPVRVLSFLSGPSRYKDKDIGPLNSTATNLYLLGGVKSSALKRHLEEKGREFGLSKSRVNRLIEELSKVEVSYTRFDRWIGALRPEIGLTQAQLAKFVLVSPGPDEPLAMPEASFKGGLVGGFFQGVLGGVAKAALSRIATKVITAAVAAPTGPLAFVIAELVSRIPDFISWAKRMLREYGMAFGAAIFGFGVLIPIPVLRVPLMATGGAVGIGGALSKFGGAQKALARGGATLQNLAYAAVATTVTGLGIPLIIAMISVPVAVALILFIINSGAYVVPPAPDITQISGLLTSPFIDIQKTPSPKGPFSNGRLPLTIEYKVTVSAKKGALTNIRFNNKCEVIRKGSGPPCVAPTPSEIPEVIAPGNPYIFTYTQTYTSPDYVDSLVTDIFEVTADTPDQPDARAGTSASIKIGTPPISCPLPAGVITVGSYNSGSETGHGSNQYWKAMGGICLWSLPQTTGCLGPTNSGNVCSDKPSCPYYGYAIDVFPTGPIDIFAPTVRGESLVWRYNGVFFSNGGGSRGYSFGYTDTSGKYSILFTHIKNNANTGSSIQSGEKIGELYPQGSNTHVHLEFQENGQYQRPELYFCQ